VFQRKARPGKLFWSAASEAEKALLMQSLRNPRRLVIPPWADYELTGTRDSGSSGMAAYVCEWIQRISVRGTNI